MSINWQIVMPELLVLSTFILLLVFDLVKSIKKSNLPWLAMAGTSIAFYISLDALRLGSSGTVFNEMLQVDRSSLFFNLVFLGSTTLIILLSMAYLEREESRQGQYYSLILLATLGMMLMASGNDLIVIFLGLELMSLSLYLLASYFTDRARSSEAGMKYLLLGAFASGFFLYGIALIYSSTGETNVLAIAGKLDRIETNSLLIPKLGMFLLMVGFGFKVAVVPFHQWAPDVYDGAPTSVTAFIGTAPKAAGFAALLKVLNTALPTLQADWIGLLTILAILSMTIGNLIALTQRNLKRMLAYSSIAHAGYLLVGITAGKEGIASAKLYLALYCLMNIGAFGTMILARTDRRESLTLNDYAGIGFRKPLIGILMSLMFLSLAGFPPTAGFIGKFYLFRSALKSGHIFLVIVASLNTAISAFYYLRLIVAIYMKPAESRLELLPYPKVLIIALLTAAIGIIVFGILPTQLTTLIEN